MKSASELFEKKHILAVTDSDVFGIFQKIQENYGILCPKDLKTAG